LQEICSIVKVYLNIANALANQEKVFSGTIPVIKLAINEEQTLNLVMLVSKLQKMSQKRAIYSLITLLLKSPKPYQSDLNTAEILKSALALDQKSSLYLNSLIEGGLPVETLQNLVENEINSTAEGIEALRLVWINLSLLKPNQLF
jgi:hypothetical protein